MYGNTTLPGITPGKTTRNDGSIWRGYTEATWFKTVDVSGTAEEAVKIPLGTILIQDLTEGTYSPMRESDIIATVADLPGTRLVIVADSTGTSGTTTAAGSENEEGKTANAVLVGIMGVVNQDRLIVGSKLFEELTEAQRLCLRTQLEGWNFQLVPVLQA